MQAHLLHQRKEVEITWKETAAAEKMFPSTMLHAETCMSSCTNTHL